MAKRPLLATVVLAGLVLLAILVGLTHNRLEANRVIWQASLSRQGAFILASFRAVGRAGMGRMGLLAERRLQALAEELAQAGLVEEVFLLDQEGRIMVHSQPAQVGRIEPQAAELWAQARLDEPGGVFGSIEPDGFKMVRVVRRIVALPPPPSPPGPGQPFRPRQPGQGGPPPTPGWPFGARGSGAPQPPLVHHHMMDEAEQAFLGVIRLPLVEYDKARRAEIRQSLGLGAGIFGAALAVVVALLLFHDRRLLRQLKITTGHLIEQMPAGLLAADERGEVVTANLQARSMFGLSRFEEVRASLATILGPALLQQLVGLGPDQSMGEVETTLGFGPGKLPAAISAVRVTPSATDPTAYIVLIRDLRPVKELEERLRRSERLAALGRLSAGVAHEIRNPLSSIRGLAQYLKSKLPEGSDESGYAQVMIGEADRLNRVVSDLLSYARPRPPQTQPTDLAELARKVAGLVQEQAARQGVTLELELDPGLPALDLDPDQFTQVILNLVLNALEAEARTITLAAGQEGHFVTLTVADDGPGVPEVERGRVFDPFVTTKANGSGLGLAISQRIVEEHGGRLTLRDSDQGAVFELRLPRPSAAQVED